MTGTSDETTQWRRITVLLRADIVENARARNIDISQTCNQALAGILGIDLARKQTEPAAASRPVVVAPDAVVVEPLDTGGADKKILHPVVNANDPAAVRTLLKAGKRPQARSAAIPAAPLPAAEISNAPDTNGATPKAKQPTNRKKAHPAKRGKEDPVRLFVSEILLRDDQDDSRIAKEELFDLFSRWCRDHKIRQVPDKRCFTSALKTQYAFQEKTVDGISCWLNVRIK